MSFVDLNAIAQMHATRKENSTSNSIKQLADTFMQIAEKEKAHDNALLAIKGKDVDTAIGSLNYMSDANDVDKAREANNLWLEEANSTGLFTNAKDKELHQAIWESKDNAIKRQENASRKYGEIGDNIDDIWDDLEALKQSDDEEYDFPEIESVLKDYENAGVSMIKFDTNWIGKEEYKGNMKEIKTWVEQGKKFQKMDIDPFETTIRTEEISPERTDIIQEQLDPIDMSALKLDSESLDIMAGQDNFDNILNNSLRLPTLTEFLPDGTKLNPEQVDLYNQALESVHAGRAFSQNVIAEGGAWGEGILEVDMEPTGELEGHDKWLKKHYETSTKAVNMFLDSLEREGQEGVEKIIPAEMKTIVETTGTQGLQ